MMCKSQKAKSLFQANQVVLHTLIKMPKAIPKILMMTCYFRSNFMIKTSKLKC